MSAQSYLGPVREAANLLEILIAPEAVAELAAVIDKLGKFPGDVISRLAALQRLASRDTGTVEELEILQSVWPDYSGSVRYKLTATTLQWCWSSKHSGRYATISVPFPTILPLTFTVERYADMDDQANHSDYCPQLFAEEDEESEGECNCEAEVEQTVTLTINDWNSDSATVVGDWLARAVDEQVEEVRI